MLPLRQDPNQEVQQQRAKAFAALWKGFGLPSERSCSYWVQLGEEGRARANELAEFAKLQESQKKEAASKVPQLYTHELGFSLGLVGVAVVFLGNDMTVHMVAGNNIDHGSRVSKNLIRSGSDCHARFHGCQAGLASLVAERAAAKSTKRAA